MSDYVHRNKIVDSRVESLPCVALTLPPTNRNFIWPSYEELFEAVIPNSEGDRHTWKTFEHYKRSTVPVVGITTEGSVANHLDVFQSGHKYYDYAATADPFGWFCGEFGSAGQPLDGLTAWFDSTLDDGFIPNPADLEGLKQRSLRTMLPLIKSELSLVNSLIELKDFKTLPKTITNIKNFTRDVLGNKTWRGTGATLRRLTRTASDGYLQASFNLIPLYSDLRGIYTALTATKKRLNALISGQGHTQRKHFRLALTVPDTVGEQQTFVGPTAGYGTDPHVVVSKVASKATRYVYTDVSTFHAEIEYNYNFTQYQLEHAQVLAFLDALGVNFNPAIIWNAIPWSFTVDWVLGVSQWLNNRKTLNMEPLINIHNYLWSWTGRRRILVYRSLARPLIYHDIEADEYSNYKPAVPLPVTTESAYKRFVGLPNAGSILTSGLSLKEFSLGAALVLVREKRHKRR